MNGTEEIGCCGAYRKTCREYKKGSTAQFGKSIRPKILPHTKVIKGREYCMYFPLL